MVEKVNLNLGKLSEKELKEFNSQQARKGESVDYAIDLDFRCLLFINDSSQNESLRYSLNF